MYTITFYSFKGGVGRSMALANVALELARRGRRVLLVDFDLEAPGLDTFPLLRPKTPGKGIVDFVADYQVTGTSPDVKDFVYQAELPATVAGTVLVMPTGLPGEQYGVRLNGIDWQQLYSERNGFLLFEDLKEQWKQTIHPDYVLVDSRTGHTDVGGICTRQLPDAVALLFFPNEQNERGMATVVEDIRAEKSRTGKDIALYFVASNVPELDDEDRILFQRIKHFRQTLKCDEPETIHRYDSLALLDQKIFTNDRPKSKLAREYRRLTQRIIGNNYEDRDAAMRHLDQMRAPGYRARLAEIESALKKIRILYSSDGEVLYNLAMANRSLGRDEVAEALIAEAQELGYETEETLVAKALPAYARGDAEFARQLIQQSLGLPRGRFFRRGRTVRAVVTYDAPYLPVLVQTLSNGGLSPQDRLYLAGEMTSSVEGMQAAESLLWPVLADSSVNDADRERCITDLVLALISQSKFQEAMDLISKGRPSMMQWDVADTFNYAIAQWGVTGAVPRDLFSRVLDFLEPTRGDANFSQCLGLAFWASGDSQNARKYASLALTQLDESDLIFSCWRYFKVEAQAFRQDVSIFLALVEGNTGVPEVISRGAQKGIFH